MKRNIPEHIDLATAAKLCGISQSQFLRRVQAGKYRREARGRYRTAHILADHHNFLTGNNDPLLREQLRKLKRQNRDADARTVTADVLTEAWQRAEQTVGAVLDRLPGQVAARIAASTDAGEIEAILRHAITDARNDAAAAVRKLDTRA